MDALNVAGWQATHPHDFLALMVTLPDRVLYLTSGGVVAFSCTDHAGVTATRTFVPSDPDYGIFASVGAMSDGDVGSALPPDLGFEPYSEAGLAALTGPAAQGSPWTLWWGLVNPDTGAVIGAPTELYNAALNVASPEFGPGRRGVVISSFTEAQRQFTYEGAKLADHPVIGRLLPRTTRKIYWRGNDPYPHGRAGGGGGGGTGGGPGGGIDMRLF